MAVAIQGKTGSWIGLRERRAAASALPVPAKFRYIGIRMGFSCKRDSMNHMGRIPIIDCPACQEPGLRRIYLQNAATSERPRHEAILTWLYCESCDTMHNKTKKD